MNLRNQQLILLQNICLAQAWKNPGEKNKKVYHIENRPNRTNVFSPVSHYRMGGPNTPGQPDSKQPGGPSTPLGGPATPSSAMGDGGGMPPKYGDRNTPHTPSSVPDAGAGMNFPVQSPAGGGVNPGTPMTPGPDGGGGGPKSNQRFPAQSPGPGGPRTPGMASDGGGGGGGGRFPVPSPNPGQMGA